MPNSSPHRHAITLIGGLALTAAVFLPASAAAAPVTTAPQAQDEQQAPHTGPETSCVTVNAGWRYAFVTNDCPYQVTVRVTYTDEDTSACRTIEPGLVATFPGYGPGEYRLPRVAAC